MNRYVESFSVFGILLLIASLFLLSGCNLFARKPDISPLCKSECPDLSPLPDPTFGATTSALKRNADIYYNCRTACQGPQK
jgi:hypothetical protein